MPGFPPRYDVLPPPQRNLCSELRQIPRHFVLYSGTAIALRLGHRVSLDFDFFTSEAFAPDRLLAEIPLLSGAEILQNVSQTLTDALDRKGRVKLSFFGGLHLGRVGSPNKLRTARYVLPRFWTWLARRQSLSLNERKQKTTWTCLHFLSKGSPWHWRWAP